ncbi:DNA methylase N-4 [Fervidobacterium riparium]|nr:DNA methylase N-4 [Fervidobacterium riparium]
MIIGDSRKMREVNDEEVDLIVTSPPYWHIKDYGVNGQIGYGQTLHEYLNSLYCVWSESYRVLRNGGRLCVNVGDQFARAVVYGRYKVIPIHAEIIAQCEDIGFDFMGSIIWQKKTTMNTTGGANVMGSYPYPPNGIVELDYEYILIFKKPGDNKKVPKEVKEASKLSKEEWKEYFSGHWTFGGTKQIGHEAMFPEELPRRLIKMFTFVGDTVLDPFLGSGTTAKVALELNRNVIGYEINKDFLEMIKTKIGIGQNIFLTSENIQIIEREQEFKEQSTNNYVPRIKDAKPQIEPNKLKFTGERLYRVVDIIDECTLKLDTGLAVRFLGIKIEKKKEAIEYLQKYVLGKNVFLKLESAVIVDSGTLIAYIYLKNKIFINAYLIKSGIAVPDFEVEHRYKNKFLGLWEEIRSVKRMDSEHSYKPVGFK